MESSPQKRVLFQDLVRTHGSPLYVYDGQIIADRVSRLKRAFGGFPHKLHYAAKALSNLSILRLIRSLGCGLDAVSIQEVQLGFMAGFEPDEILFTPNNVPFVEIEQAVGLGVHVNLDSLSSIRKFGEALGINTLFSFALIHIFWRGETRKFKLVISTPSLESPFSS
jgi:diaminopimelate decarboxylase